MTVRQALNKAFKKVGKTELARQLGIRHQSMNGWHLKNKMPRTEYSGETSHAMKIQIATEGEVTVEDLLGHVPHHQVVDEARQ